MQSTGSVASFFDKPAGLIWLIKINLPTFAPNLVSDLSGLKGKPV